MQSGTGDKAAEERRALVKKKLAMRGMEQRKIFDSADASMNKSAMENSKSRAAGGAKDKKTMNRPSLQQRTMNSRTAQGAECGSLKSRREIREQTTARTTQQAAESGSLGGKKAEPQLNEEEKENATVEVKAETESVEKEPAQGVQPEEQPAETVESAEQPETTTAAAAEESGSSPKKLMTVSLGARSPLDMASLLCQNMDPGASSNDPSADSKKHIILPIASGGDKEITVNPNKNNGLLDAASLLRSWNDMKASHKGSEASKSNLGLAVMAHSKAA